MEPMLHITERSLWEAARAEGFYRMSTRGVTLEEEGFIHFSSPHQLVAIGELLYGDHEPRDELVVLVVDPARLTDEVRHEPPAPGVEETFPHLYGPLPVDAVVAVEPWTGSAEGFGG